MSDNEVMDVSRFLNLHLKEGLEAKSFSTEKINSHFVDANDNGIEKNNELDSPESAPQGLNSTTFGILALAASLNNASNQILSSLRPEVPADGSPFNYSPPEGLSDPDFQSLQQLSQDQLSYLASTDLPEHMDVCRFCLKLLPKRKMSIHLRIHTGERPFTCEFCSKTFARSDKLKMHLRIHTGERPYRCFCGKGFARQDKCKRHISTHPHSLVLQQQQNIIAPRHDSMLSNVLRQVKLMKGLQQQEEAKSECPEEQQQENLILQQSEEDPELQTSLLLAPRPSWDQSKPDLFQLGQKKADLQLELPSGVNPSRQRLLLPKPQMMPLQAASTEQVYPGQQEEDIICKHCDCTFRSRRAYLSHVKGHTKKDIFKCPCGREFKSAKWLSNHQKREGCLTHDVASTSSLNSLDNLVWPAEVNNVDIATSSTDNLQSPSLISCGNNFPMSCSPANNGVHPAVLPVQEANNNPAPTLRNTQTPGVDQSPSFPLLLSGNGSPAHKEELDDEIHSEMSPHSHDDMENVIGDKDDDGLQPMGILEALAQSNRDKNMLDEEVSVSSATGKNNALLRLISKIKKKKKLAQEEDKRYACDFCTKTFSKKHKMHIHRRMHTGEKPYVCKVCGKAFSRKDHMIKHMNIHYKYRKQYGEGLEKDKQAEDDDLYNGDIASCSTAKDNPVLSALSGVSIMQLEQSELQTKLAALSALAKAFEIQKKEAALEVPSSVDTTNQLLSAAHVKPIDYSQGLGSTDLSSSPNGLPEDSLPSAFPHDLLHKLNKAKMKKKYTPKTLIVSSTSDEGTDNGKYKCNQCNRSYDRSHEFLAHSRSVHKVHGNSKFACGVCGIEVWTRRRFENHVVTHSDGETEVEAVTKPTKRTRQEQVYPVLGRDLADVNLNSSYADDMRSDEGAQSDSAMSNTETSPEKPTLIKLEQLQGKISTPAQLASAFSCSANNKVSLENSTILEYCEDSSRQELQAVSGTPNTVDSEEASGSEGNQPLCVEDYLSILAAAGPSTATGSSNVARNNDTSRSHPPAKESSATAAEEAASSSSEDDGAQSDSTSTRGEAFAAANAAATANGEALATVQCSLCDKMVYEYNYHRHIAKHTKVNMCSICGTKFTRRSDVTRHMKLHEREKQHHCEGCGMSFAKRDKLTLHSRRCIAGKEGAYQNLDFASLFVADA